jgi:hypothetical protein
LSVRAPLPIYARLGERVLPVNWAWYRPEPRVGDTVRLCTASDGNEEWQSFRVVGKWLRTDRTPVGATNGAEASTRGTIHLDVEPLRRQD